MLIIRNEQMDVFNNHVHRSFEKSIMESMYKHFPTHCEIIGAPQVRETVLLGIERAGNYDLFAEREVFLYISLMFLLGAGFDRDFQLPWVEMTLAREKFSDNYSKIRTLYTDAMDYLDRINGENDQEISAVLNRIMDLDLTVAIQRITRNFFEEMIALMFEIHPIKADDLGDELLRRLVSEGTEEARNYGISMEKGQLVFLLNMLLLGGSFDTDPQFHWVRTILDNDENLSESIKIESLYHATMTYYRCLLQSKELTV
jgi:hypothetical protein